MSGRPELSIVVPVHDEEGNVGPLHRELTDVAQRLGGSYELIFVNDASRDRTLERLEELVTVDRHLRVIDLDGNFGEAAALSAGFASARGAVVVTLDACGALLLHFSTDYLYDGSKREPYLESDAVGPLSVYGETKLEGERAVAGSGVKHLVLRTSWVYGPRGRNFLSTMVRLGRERPELRIVNDQRGAPTSSRALALLVREMLERGGTGSLTPAGVEQAASLGGIYHATAAGETTWYGFAQAIFDEMLRQRRLDFAPPRLVPIATREFPTPARRPANSVLSSEKLRGAFGVAIPDWRRGLEEVVSAIPG